MVLEIMFYDLKEETQKRLLKFYGVEKPEDMNWDIMPIDVIEKDEKGE